MSRVGESLRRRPHPPAFPPHPPAKAAQQDSRWAWVPRLKAFPEGPGRMVGCRDPSPAPHRGHSVFSVS